MLFLGLAMCVTGFLLALLPSFPTALPYWVGITILTLVYPGVLARTFKENRADYEFRMLHWFPFAMTLLWVALQFLAPRAKFLYILQLGFFFLWSLPLVALGIAFLILFSVHVIRRSRVRILFLSLFLVLFTVGAVASEAMGFDAELQATIYPAHPKMMATVRRAASDLRSAVATLTGTAGVTATTSSASSSLKSSTSSSVRSMIAAVSSRNTSSLSSAKPTKLPESGPESAGMLGATLLAMYMGTVHFRARKRV